MIDDIGKIPGYSVSYPVYPPPPDDKMRLAPRKDEAVPAPPRQATKLLGRVCAAVGVGAAVYAIAQVPKARAELPSEYGPILLANYLAAARRINTSIGLYVDGCNALCGYSDGKFRDLEYNMASQAAMGAVMLNHPEMAMLSAYASMLATGDFKRQVREQCAANGCYER